MLAGQQETGFQAREQEEMVGNGGERESSLNEMGWNQDLEVVQNFTGCKGVMN